MENTLSLVEFLNSTNTPKCLYFLKLFDCVPHVVGIPIEKQIRAPSASGLSLPPPGELRALGRLGGPLVGNSPHG